MAQFHGDQIVLTLTDGDEVECDLTIVQIGFLSAKETFQRLDLRLNDDGSIAIDPYYETSRRESSPSAMCMATLSSLPLHGPGRNPGRHLRFQGDHEPVHGELLIREHFFDFARLLGSCHARSGRPVSASVGDGGPTRRSRRRPSVVAESVLVKQQMLILNRSRRRSPNLRPSDRMVAGFCALSCVLAG